MSTLKRLQNPLISSVFRNMKNGEKCIEIYAYVIRALDTILALPESLEPSGDIQHL